MATYTHAFKNYRGAERAWHDLDQSRSRPIEQGWWTDYKIGHNTYLGRFHYGKAVHYGIRYHDTRIVTYCSDGGVVVTDGGWNTLTTRERLDVFTPYRFWRHKGQTMYGLTIDDGQPWLGRGRLEP